MSETTGDPLTPTGDPFEAVDDPFHPGVDEQTMTDDLDDLDGPGDGDPGEEDPGEEDPADGDPGDDLLEAEAASPT